MFCHHGYHVTTCPLCRAASQREPPRDPVVAEELPHWLVGVKYAADEELCSLTLRVPIHLPAYMHYPELVELVLQSTPGQLEAIRLVIDAVLAKARAARSVIDAPATTSTTTS
jgi:hypothetical protein